jgi:phage baseplate assembly protein gpV
MQTKENEAAAVGGYVSLAALRAEANILRSDDGENPEYDRALTELLSNAPVSAAVAELVEAATAVRDSVTLNQEREAIARMVSALSAFGGAK